MKKISIYLLFAFLAAGSAWAGNPERAGQAGATQLLVNSWARSSSINGINIGSVGGIESVGNNPAGLATTRRTELVFAHTRWLVGADININTFGFSQSVGGTGVLGVYVMAFDMGEFERTTEDNPDGGIGTFSPSITNMGISYAKKFTDNIYVGATVKMVSESIADASAVGVALDAGVQYRTNFGLKDSLHSDRFKVGISLRNIGTSMRYDGDGLKRRVILNRNKFSSQVQRTAADFEMPSQLMLGASYDMYVGTQHRITPHGAFISNSFTPDQFGIGLEYQFKEYFMIRYSLLYEDDLFNDDRMTAFTGHALGATVEIPIKTSETTISHFGLDYSYRTTDPFQGVHVFGVRVDL